MTKYAHTTDLTPKRLPQSFTHEGKLIMGLDAMTDAQLAEIGWYPVVREPLEPGASGYGKMKLVGDKFVTPSLPGDPEAVQEAYLDNLSCTRLQGRLELIAQGLWTAVQDWAVSAGEAEIAYFEDAQTWRFRDATLQAAATGMGLTEEQVIGMFESARQR